MTTSNVETATSRTDYDIRSHRSNSKDRISKPHNAQAKPEQPSGGNPPKEDTVTISEEGMNRFIGKSEDLTPELKSELSSEWRELVKMMSGKWQQHGAPGTPEWEEYIKNWEEEMKMNPQTTFGNDPYFIDSYTAYGHTSYMHKVDSEESIFGHLDGKAGNASREVANQLASMIFHTKDTDLETRIANREAARDLAKRIAENYMSDPKEAQAFIDEINKHIKDSELIDKGYVDCGFGLTPPDPMNDFDKFVLANWDKHFGNIEGARVSVNEFNSLNWFIPASKVDEFKAARRAIIEDLSKVASAHFSELNTPYKSWPDGSGGPSWEEKKEMNCDPRYSMHSEENKAWYADFVAKSNMVQNIINNAKSITDFSGNERWNVVMSLLTPKQ